MSKASYDGAKDLCVWDLNNGTCRLRLPCLFFLLLISIIPKGLVAAAPDITLAALSADGAHVVLG